MLAVQVAMEQLLREAVVCPFEIGGATIFRFPEHDIF